MLQHDLLCAFKNKGISKLSYFILQSVMQFVAWLTKHAPSQEIKEEIKHCMIYKTHDQSKNRNRFITVSKAGLKLHISLDVEHILG